MQSSHGHEPARTYRHTRRTHAAISYDRAAILGTTWEDEDHVLVSAFQNERWAVIRVGVDGTAESALPPVPDPGAGGAYVLPVR